MTHEPSLLLARHAPVVGGKGVCYGMSDLLADETESLRAAAELSSGVPKGWRVQVSPLQRCQQLARALQALRPDLRFEDDARLQELNFGAWEGVAWANISQAQFDRWLADFANACPGDEAGPGAGESVAALMRRVDDAWQEWRASGEGALWITHAGVIRAAMLLSRGTRVPATAADWPSNEIPYGQMVDLRASPHW